MQRKNAFTCSVRCRVYLHRHPEVMESYRKDATTWGVPIFTLLEGEAILKLRPDLSEKIKGGFDPIRGEIDGYEKIRPKVVSAYHKLLNRVIKKRKAK